MGLSRRILAPALLAATLSLLLLSGCGDDSASTDGGADTGSPGTGGPGDSCSSGDDCSSGYLCGAGTCCGCPSADLPCLECPGSDRDTGVPPFADGSVGDAAVSDGAVTPAGPMVDRTDPQLYEFELDPAVLDPTVADSLELQYAQLDTRTEPLGKLVFFLPGANNSPRNWRDHGRQLAEFGFHVVIPHYNNRWGSACSGMGGSCSDDTRWEALTGEDVSTVVDVARADSAEGRVIAILEHLRTAEPGGDWGYYLDDGGALRDDQIIIAGISHGASSTGLFASRRPFFRAVMHSGGYGRLGDTPATPIGDIFGFSHTDDEQHPGHLSSWSAGGLVGAPTSIDAVSPPYGDSRQLITSEANGYPHCSVAVSSYSPVDGGGMYLFEAAWRYLYGVATLTP